MTPNALTASGVTLCAVASVLVLFENRNEMLFYWLGGGRLRRRLGPRHPRRRARPRRRQDDAVRRLPRLDDRPRQRGLHARARSRYVFARHGHDVFVAVAVAAVAGSFLVSYTRARAEALGLQRRRRHRLARRARRRDHRRARARAVGRAARGRSSSSTATAWITVVQRVLSVGAAPRSLELLAFAALALLCYHYWSNGRASQRRARADARRPQAPPRRTRSSAAAASLNDVAVGDPRLALRGAFEPSGRRGVAPRPAATSSCACRGS